MAGLFVVRTGVYRRRALGAGVVDTIGVVNVVGLQVSNRSLGGAKVVALVRAGLELGLLALNCF